MKKIFSSFIIFTLIMLAAGFIEAIQWKISPDYFVKFKGKYADGNFKTLKGSILFDEKELTAAKFDIIIDVNSISTGIGLKNHHAKGEKWFDAEKYPTIHFTASGAKKTKPGYETTGDLVMHGVKKALTIPFTFTKKAGGGTFYGKFDVNRADYHIGETKGNEKDFVHLEVSVPVNQ